MEDQLVDFKPTCGNILTGVGPAAIEMGLVEAQEGETAVNILAVNTQARVAAVVQTSRFALFGPQLLSVTNATTCAVLQHGSIRGGLERLSRL